MPKRRKTILNYGGRPPQLSWQKLPSRDLRVILHLRSEFRINRPIWRRDIANPIFNMASVRHLEFENFRFFCQMIILGMEFASAYQIWSKSDNSRLRYGDKAIFKMAAVHHLELNLRKLPFWSRDLYPHVILHRRSEFRINRLWRREPENDFQ